MKARQFSLWIMIGAVLSLLSVTVLAHEGREVGEYELNMGWRNEPAFVGQFNGPEVYISLHHAPEGTAFPADVEVSLQAEVMFGSETKKLRLEPAWGETGHFIADLIPTLPGDYTFRIFGKIGDVEVDEVFSSADGEFSTVEPASDIMFPAAGAVDMAALLARIEALEARLAALENQ